MLTVGLTPPALAAGQETTGFVEALTRAVAPRWEGPRTDWPDASPRPPSDGALVSPLQPLRVHPGDGVSVGDAEAALSALEAADRWLTAHGWPRPYPDGGLGGDSGFDLYLRAAGAANELEVFPDDTTAVDRTPRPVSVGHDGPVLYEALDAATTFAVLELDPRLGPAERESCIMSAYVEAALLGQDPAEAPAWRIATGDFVGFLATGRFGCGDQVVEAQQDPVHPWVGDDPATGGGGALFLAMLSARTDRLSGTFIRDVWSGARQRTWEGEGLRASPDFWEVLDVVMTVGEDPLDRLVEELAVTRFFTGPEERTRGAPIPMLRELPAEAEVPILGSTRWSSLPRRVEPHGLQLEPHGSAYVWVDTADARPGSTMRIWLRGEYGVAWSLLAVRLDADGQELGRVRAPPRPRNPSSYIPLELVDGDTASVLVVVTNVGVDLFDADLPSVRYRSFRLVLDKVEPDPAPTDGDGDGEDAAAEEAAAEEAVAAAEEESPE